MKNDFKFNNRYDTFNILLRKNIYLHINIKISLINKQKIYKKNA